MPLPRVTMRRRIAAIRWTRPLLQAKRLASVALLGSLMAASGGARAPVRNRVDADGPIATAQPAWSMSVSGGGRVIYAPTPAIALPAAQPVALPPRPSDPDESQPFAAMEQFGAGLSKGVDVPIWLDDAPILKTDLLPPVPHPLLSDPLPPEKQTPRHNLEALSIPGELPALSAADIHPALVDPPTAPLPPTFLQPVPEPTLLPLLMGAALLPRRRRSPRPASPARSLRSNARR